VQSGDMTSNRYQPELSVAVDLAREAGALILNFYEGPLDIEQKTSSDDSEPVTQADTLANELIVSRLARDFPGDGILAEESIDTERRLDKSRVWMVDPLDGTSGFIAGNGDFAVQIGLVEDGICVVGVVDLPLKNILYRAVLDQGTYIESTDGSMLHGWVMKPINYMEPRRYPSVLEIHHVCCTHRRVARGRRR